MRACCMPWCMVLLLQCRFARQHWLVLMLAMLPPPLRRRRTRHRRITGTHGTHTKPVCAAIARYQPTHNALTQHRHVNEAGRPGAQVA